MIQQERNQHNRSKRSSSCLGHYIFAQPASKRLSVAGVPGASTCADDVNYEASPLDASDSESSTHTLPASNMKAPDSGAARSPHSTQSVGSPYAESPDSALRPVVERKTSSSHATNFGRAYSHQQRGMHRNESGSGELTPIAEENSQGNTQQDPPEHLTPRPCKRIRRNSLDSSPNSHAASDEEEERKALSADLHHGNTSVLVPVEVSASAIESSADTAPLEPSKRGPRTPTLRMQPSRRTIGDIGPARTPHATRAPAGRRTVGGYEASPSRRCPSPPNRIRWEHKNAPTNAAESPSGAAVAAGHRQSDKLTNQALTDTSAITESTAMAIQRKGAPVRLPPPLPLPRYHRRTIGGFADGHASMGVLTLPIVLTNFGGQIGSPQATEHRSRLLDHRLSADRLTNRLRFLAKVVSLPVRFFFLALFS
eukprot:GHVU01032327.1.p2 GENE.GHVU01032327.1~~GHVU01032327.1.p2  ORF type:complete len:425 (+),score=14.42 GHVU01032327.1:512-1786(+)